MHKTVSVFGSTGSVGKSTIALLLHHKEKYQVETLTANKNAALLADQAKQLNAKYAVIVDETKAKELRALLQDTKTEVMVGRNALLDMASKPVDWIMMAIVGMAGLEPIFKALPNGKALAIANKEPLVSAGALLMSEAKRYGTTILPVDSEHNAIFQVFEQGNKDAIDKIILTASGGPFRTWDKDAIARATPEQAVAHPNWSMGAKISVDSASMMNKGLEVIEAHHLFGLPSNQIDVIVHPQSIVHSMVQYCDGSVLAQMGAPDMTTPIASALAYPQRLESCGQRLNIKELSTLSFEEPDTGKFPALSLAYHTLNQGGAAPLVLNAANEIAVEAFLKKKIAFGDMMNVIEDVLAKENNCTVSNLEDIVSLDMAVRSQTRSQIDKYALKNTHVA